MTSHAVTTDPNALPRLGIGPMLASIASHWRLILQLTKREVISRYRGSVMGLAWSFFNPVLMLAVYTFVFTVVFKARWGTDGGDHGEFAIFLFAGILTHGILAECLTRAPSLILGNVSYVKRVVFPLEILPWIALGGALFHAAISLCVLLCAQLLVMGELHWTAILLPVVIAPLALMTMGFAWFLAGLGVYVRDINHIIGIIVTVLLFMSPVFYPLEALPPVFRTWLYANPLTFIIEQVRSVLLLGHQPDWPGLAWYAAAGFAVAWTGFAAFQKLRRGFADVL